MPQFQLDVKADKKVAKNFDALIEAAGDVKPALHQIGIVAREGFGRNFSSQGSHFGGSWPALAAFTLQKKAQEGLPGATLVASGALRASLNGGAGSIFRVANTQVTIGTRDFKARFHQSKRRLVGVSRDDRSKMFKIAADHFAKAAR